MADSSFFSVLGAARGTLDLLVEWELEGLLAPTFLSSHIFYSTDCPFSAGSICPTVASALQDGLEYVKPRCSKWSDRVDGTLIKFPVPSYFPKTLDPGVV